MSLNDTQCHQGTSVPSLILKSISDYKRTKCKLNARQLSVTYVEVTNWTAYHGRDDQSLKHYHILSANQGQDFLITAYINSKQLAFWTRTTASVAPCHWYLAHQTAMLQCIESLKFIKRNWMTCTRKGHTWHQQDFHCIFPNLATAENLSGKIIAKKTSKD